MSESESPNAELRALIYEALADVIDPEIGLDIITLGLVYDVTLDADDVAEVTFTLTTRGCPMEHAMRAGISRAVAAVSGVRSVRPKLVWQPRWHSGMVKEGALW